MLARTTKLIAGLTGMIILSGFVLGLAHSISTGFAGILGGLPFVIISLSVLCMAGYDFWDECIRKSDE